MLDQSNDARPVRIALAGFGTVGEGVFQRLQRDPRSYEVVRILCRDAARHAAKPGVAHLLTENPDDVTGADLLVEALGGIELPMLLVERALRQGADVVTANKSLVARRHRALCAAAEQSGACLRYSAAVGGGVPMLETVEELAPQGIKRIDAIVNGTTNFVLSLVEAALPLPDAVRAAQQAGFAEADPSSDIDGGDAAEKLSLLIRAAFGADIDPDDIPKTPLRSVQESEIALAGASGKPFKQIASAWREPEGVKAEVGLRQAPAGTPLAETHREDNCLVIAWGAGGQSILTGKGAGRDPTADSVMSDVQFLAGRKKRAISDHR
jgi:homoserine dehydrogenase